MSSIKLEEGKYYRSRIGTRSGPMKYDYSEHASRLYPWIDGPLTFREDGGYLGDAVHPLDLVAEWVDEPPAEKFRTDLRAAGPFEAVPLPAGLNFAEGRRIADEVRDEEKGPERCRIPADDRPEPTSELRLPDDNPKTVFGVAKPGVHCIPPSALLHLGQAMANGEAKYGLMNWREDRVSASTYYDAAVARHFPAWWDGEDYAGDSGVHHLAHVMACCAILIDAIETGMLNDDRPIKGNLPELIARLTKKPA